jgi:putative ABC transport system permease protein
MFFKDLTYAARQLRSRPGFAFAGILTMALGIGANTAIFSFVNALLLRPLPFPEPDRLVRIDSVRGQETGKLLPREWEELERDRRTFAGVAAWYPTQYNLSAGGKPEVVRACMTTANLFRVLGVRLIHGSSWEEGTHRQRNPSVVLNYELWHNRLGRDAAITGKSITMDQSPYLVTGVAEPGFQFPVRSDVFRAANLGGAQNQDVRSLYVVARLQRGITMQQSQLLLDAFAAEQERAYPDSNRGIRFQVISLREAYTGEVRPFLLLTLGLVALVLLIACANVVNLLLARGLARRKEIAVRLALGAGRRDIMRQVVLESVLLTLLGGVAGLGLAAWWMRVLREMLRVDLPPWMSIELDPVVLLFTTVVSIGCGVMAGLAPAISSARADLLSAFQDASRGSSGGRAHAGIRRALVAGELALAVTLLIAAGLLVRSFQSLQDTDTGFERERMLTFRTDPPWARYNRVEQTSLFYRLALERLQALPGVEAAAANHSLPLALNQNYGKPSIIAEGQDLETQRRNPFVNIQVVSPNYFDVMKIRLRAGRAFHASDRIATTPVTVLSRPLADRLFAGADPLGRRIRMAGLLSALDEKQENWFTVVGVAEGVRSESLLSDVSMDLYLSNQQQFAGDTFFVVRTRQDATALSTAVAQAILQVDPEQPVFDVQPLDDLVEASVWQRRIAGRLSLWFGGLALVLAAVGAYSVIAYAVSQRTRELGIRQALGSTSWQTQQLVLGDAMSLAAVGLGSGAVLGYAVAWSVSGLLYRVSPLDPWIYGGVLGSVGLVALLACYVPARRAARIQPVEALRQE